MAALSPTLPFGRLGRAHGVRGELVLRPFNDEADAPTALPVQVELVRGDQRRVWTLLAIRPFAQDFLVRFDGIASREEAAALTNHELWLPRDSLPPPDEGEVYVEDLVGCTVVDTGGRPRGTVTAAFWNGAHDVLTVTGGDGEELLVPAVPEFLREVDLEARRLVVDPHE